MILQLPLNKSLTALSFALVIGVSAQAQAVIDDPIDSGDGWNNATAGGFTASVTASSVTLSPVDGTGFWRLNASAATVAGVQKNFGLTLAEGTYTVEFYVGYINSNSRPYVGDANVYAGFYDAAASLTSGANLQAAITDFRTGMGVTFASVATATPAIGTFEKWTYTFTVDDTSPLLGSAVNFGFAANATVASFVAFDSLTVNFASAAPVPEPGTYALIGGAAALGLALWRRRVA